MITYALVALAGAVAGIAVLWLYVIFSTHYW